MKILGKIKNVTSLILLALFIINCSEGEKMNFIQRDGNILKDGDSTYRFLSFNIPNINFIEDEMEFTKPHSFRLPTSFEIRDAFESVKQMGGNVVRAYTFPVKRESDTLDIPRYVLGPGVFDENAFKVMDTVLALANETEIRLILPLLNNWKWMGGVPQYAAFRNKSEEEFWTDSLLISDFKRTIDYVLNRTNTITGIQYKNDKSILCWETGNELSSPYSWVKEIATYIKSIDTNHLLMDGYNAIDGVDIHAGSLEDSLIDIVSTHHYKLNPIEIVKDIKAQLKRVDGRKPYIVGEFGFLGTTAIEQISNFIIENDIVGGLVWSLRSHREEGGFFWHSEPFGGDIFKAFHYPGFSSGIDYNEEKFMQMYHEKAFQIRNISLPKIERPNSPTLLPIVKNSEISWQGSVGANFYDVERSETSAGPWIKAGYNISDAIQYYRPLFNDYFAEIGKSYYYRIIAKNEGGNSEPSNIVGPVKTEVKTLIDEMENQTVLYHIEGRIKLASGQEREFKEDPHRIEVNKGNSLIYYVPGKISSFKVFSFSKTDSSSLKFSLSSNGIDFQEVKVKRESFFIGKGDYNFWVPSIYDLQILDFTKISNYLKIEVEDLNQISRVEIDFIPR
jgi:mannan endo-1,4-beta-mannosidase